MIDYLLMNLSGLGNLGFFFLLNTSIIFLIVHFIYAKNSKRKDFYFSYMSIGAIIFLLCFFLNSVKLELGFALGLFAIFGIIRYRTDAIPIKEMTYLFIVIGVSVLNSLAFNNVNYPELLFTNATIVVGLWLLEKRLLLKQEISIDLVYEKIENINKQSEKELLEDLINRTGIEITRFEIRKIDFLRDVAEITLFYNMNGQNHDDELIRTEKL